jgi:hypothetical protein
MDQPDVTVCAIVKDERPYLIEWVAYYRLLGFDRIVLYSNDCTDGTDALLDAMQAADMVEHRRWPSRPGIPPQKVAYQDAAQHCATRWILFVDADEFLHLDGDPDIHAFIRSLDDGVSAVAFSWRVFGSSGHRDRGEDPVVQRFDRAAPPDHPLNWHVKTMAVAQDVALFGVHGMVLARGDYVNARGEEVTLHRHAQMEPVAQRAWINHYVVKSEAEYRAKRARGSANRAIDDPAKRTTRDDNFFAQHDHNQVIDRAIQVRLPELRREMAAISAAVGS